MLAGLAGGQEQRMPPAASFNGLQQAGLPETPGPQLPGQELTALTAPEAVVRTCS